MPLAASSRSTSGVMFRNAILLGMFIVRYAVCDFMAHVPSGSLAAWQLHAQRRAGSRSWQRDSRPGRMGDFAAPVPQSNTAFATPANPPTFPHRGTHCDAE